MARDLELAIPTITHHHGRPIINYPHLPRLPETYPILAPDCLLRGNNLRISHLANRHLRFIPIMTDPRLPYRADNKDLESMVAIIRHISGRPRIDLPRCRLCLLLHWIIQPTEISNPFRNRSTHILAGAHILCSPLPSPPLDQVMPQGRNLPVS